MLTFALWSVGALIAAGYCSVRGIGDLRRGRHAAGMIGIGSAAIFLLTPIQTPDPDQRGEDGVAGRGDAIIAA